MTFTGSESARGFSVIELLVALTICAIVSASVAIVVPPARAVFGIVPAELELQQRTGMLVEAIAQAIRAAGGDAVASNQLGSFAGLVPAIVPSDAVDGRFTRLMVTAPRINAAQGVIERHQVGGLGALWLGTSPCPDASGACGFTRGTTALITDGSGRFDVFTVSSVDPVARILTAERAFVPPYTAGSVIVEADVDTFQLEAQPDGTHTLVRVSAAGAVQPIADRVESLAFEAYGFNDSGALLPIGIAALTDGPWWRGDPRGLYDEDVFRIKYVDVAVTVIGVPTADLRRSIRFGVAIRNGR